MDKGKYLDRIKNLQLIQASPYEPSLVSKQKPGDKSKFAYIKRIFKYFYLYSLRDFRI